jgi:hypothetical protein
MPWDEQGNLRCGNESLYGCRHMTERGTRASTDLLARRRGWRIWGDDANCPECAKPARASRTLGSLDQEGLPGVVFPEIPQGKARKKGKREAS